MVHKTACLQRENTSTDLLKTLDCLSYELLIAKLNAYRFGLKALKLMNN